MARTPKFKKDEQVIYNSEIHTVHRDQYEFRNKQVVDITCDHGVHTFRVLASELRRTESVKPVNTSPYTSMASIVEQMDSGIITNTCAPQPNKYERQIINKVGESICIDVYDVLDAFNVTDAAIAHAIKKLLAPGQRGSKSLVQDLQEAIASVERGIDRQHSKYLRG